MYVNVNSSLKKELLNKHLLDALVGSLETTEKYEERKQKLLKKSLHI